MNRTYRISTRGLAASVLALGLAGCTTPLDLDMREHFDQFSTAEAARLATADRPRPDDRGVISYPNYQVAVARQNDTVADLAERVGVDPAATARHNGLKVNDPLRKGEVISLPKRVAEPSPATGAIGSGPILPPSADDRFEEETTDIASLANGALDRAGDRRVETTTLEPVKPAPAARKAVPKKQTGKEPVRHKVKRGETAYTVARLYGVPVKALSEWNGLDAQFTIREGQYLLIPVTVDAPAPTKVKAEVTEPPGTGSPTPVPPSAKKPLPAEKTEPAAKVQPEAQKKPVADVGKQTAKSTARMAYPVRGKIIREYAKGRNDGIDIAASAGSAVGAADGGQVAAITADAEGNHVIVLRHEGKILTIYSNVTKIAVKEKQTVKKGQKLAEIPSGKNAFLHFEVRKGLESTDPLPYLQ